MAHKTDGSVLGDLADKNSPRHSAAAQMFQKQWDALPDLDEPPSPSERRLFDGDCCKVRGEAMVFRRSGNGGCWFSLADLMQEITLIEIRPGPIS